MSIAALGDRAIAMLVGLYTALLVIAAAIKDGYRLTACNAHHVAFLKIDEAIGNWQQGHWIRGQEAFADADPDDQRAALAGTDDHVGLGLVDDRQRIGAIKTRDHRLYRREQVLGTVEFTGQQVRDDLGIGL